MFLQSLRHELPDHFRSFANPTRLRILERLGKWLDWTYALGYLGVALATRGQCAVELACGSTAEMRSYRRLNAHLFLSIIYLYRDDLTHMLQENDQVVQEAQQAGEWLLVYWAFGLRTCCWAWEIFPGIQCPWPSSMATVRSV